MKKVERAGRTVYINLNLITEEEEFQILKTFLPLEEEGEVRVRTEGHFLCITPTRYSGLTPEDIYVDVTRILEG